MNPYLRLLALYALFALTFGGLTIGLFAPTPPRPKYRDLNAEDERGAMIEILRQI